MKSGIRSVLQTMIGGLLLLIAPILQAQPTEGEKFGDWAIACETIPDSGETVCHIEQGVTSQETDEPVMHTAVGYLPGRPEATMIITVPLGIYLPPGMRLRFDGNDENALGFPVEMCDPVGCRTGIPLEEELLSRFKNGTEAELMVMNGNKKGVIIPMSLKGFTEGIESLQQ